jgi:hypothetical protein
MNAFYSLLNTFFKNFDRKNWSSALLKGKLHFKNLEFNEVVIHQLLELPPHTLLRSMTCDDLRIKASWTKLGSKPIEVHVGTIALELVEAPTLRKPPRIVQIEPPPPGQYKRSFATGIVENMNITIDAIRITFRPLGNDAGAPLPPLPLVVSLDNLSICVADARFNTRVNLPDLISAAKQLAAQSKPVVLYRVIDVERIALAFGDCTILDRSSIGINVAATLNSHDGHLEGATIAVNIDRLAFTLQPLSADALLATVETMFWLKKKPYDDTTVRCVTLPTHPPPRDVDRVVEPSDAGVVLADDAEYAKKYGRLIPNRRSRFEPLFEKTWKVEVNIGIINFDWADDEATAAAAAAANVSSGCVVSINGVHVSVFFNDRPLAPDAAEAAARQRVEFLASKQRVIDDRAEALRVDDAATPSNSSSAFPRVAQVSAATRARAESLELAALARHAAHAQRMAAADATSVDDDAALRLRLDVADVLADVEEIREREIAAAHGKPLPAVPGASPPTKKKNVAKKAVKWTAKVTKTATKATVRATKGAIRAVNPIRSASKRDVAVEAKASAAAAATAAAAAVASPKAAVSASAASPARALSPAPVATTPVAASSRATPQLPPKVLPAAAVASVAKGKAAPATPTKAASSAGGADDDDDESEALRQMARGPPAGAGKGPRAKSDGGDDATEGDWFVVDNEPARTVQVASGKDYKDELNPKWRAELTDATVRVNVTVALLTIRDSVSPGDTSTYLLQPLMDDKTRRGEPAVTVKLEVELCHDEHLAVDVGVTMAPMVLRAEENRWAAVAAAVLPRAVRSPPWLPPSDPDEFNSINVLVRLMTLRVTLPPAMPNVRSAHGLVVCTMRDVGFQIVDHDRAAFSAAAFPEASSPALPTPGLGLGRLCVRAGVQALNLSTRFSSNDDADDTTSDTSLLDSAPIAFAATLESWRALLRWTGECETIERELLRRAAEDDDGDASPLLALVPDVTEALRDICHARVVLVAQQVHAAVDLPGYERAVSVLASYVAKPAAPPTAPTAPATELDKSAPTELSLIRAVPIQLDVDVSVGTVSLRLELAEDEHLPWVLQKPPVDPASHAHADRQSSISGPTALAVEASTWDPLSESHVVAATPPPKPQAEAAAPAQRARATVRSAAAKRDVFLLRVQHIGVHVNTEALPVPERRAQARLGVTRPHFECGRKVTATPLGVVLSPIDLIDERALLRKETRPSEVWFSLDCPLRVRDTGTAADAPVATVDFQRAGDGTAELGVIGLAVQLHILEADVSDVVGAPAPPSPGAASAPVPPPAFLSEHIKADDFFQLSDVIAINSLMRRLAGKDAPIDATPPTPLGGATDMAPLSVELMLSDCDARVYNRRGGTVRVDDAQLLNSMLSSTLTAIGAQRLARLRLDGGGEIAGRQRSKTSLLLAEQQFIASKAAPVVGKPDAVPQSSSEVEFERDALRKTVVDLRHELEALRIDRESISRQLRVLQSANASGPSDESRLIIGSLQETVRDLSQEVAAQRVKLSSN